MVVLLGQPVITELFAVTASVTMLPPPGVPFCPGVNYGQSAPADQFGPFSGAPDTIPAISPIDRGFDNERPLPK